MSLIVSLRVSDGIVVAADSLSTGRNILELGLEAQCPSCKTKISPAQMRSQKIAIPYSASSYTQKLFPLFGKYAVASFGMGIINSRSIYYHVKQFESLNEKHKQTTIRGLKDRFVSYMEQELLAQYPKYRDEAPEDWRPVSFHLNGFDKINERYSGKTLIISVGKNSQTKEIEDIGCTASGAMTVVQKLWDIGKDDPRQQIKYGLLSLQDAVDLTEYLIDTTSRFQRFANEVPTVGGQIDIALLTPFHGFQWIKRKELLETLDGPRDGRKTK